MVSLNWGIKDLDRSDVGMWDATDLGKLVWDDTFTVAPARNQKALIDMCIYLRDSSPIVRNSQVTCWILDMEEYVNSSGTNCAAGKKMPLESEADFYNCLLAFATTEEGEGHFKSQNVYYDMKNKRIKYMRVSA